MIRTPTSTQIREVTAIVLAEAVKRRKVLADLKAALLAEDDAKVKELAKRLVGLADDNH